VQYGFQVLSVLLYRRSFIAGTPFPNLLFPMSPSRFTRGLFPSPIPEAKLYKVEARRDSRGG
jgi:hypothetical protein